MRHITRSDYELRRKAIQSALGVEDEEMAIVCLYRDELLSASQIESKLLDAGVKITVRSIQRILSNHGVSRTNGDAFRLAASQGRIKWAYHDPRFKARPDVAKKKRYEILKRDNFRCVLCGSSAEKSLLEVDHIIARCNGGSNEPENLRTLCEPCNYGKRYVEKEDKYTS